MFRFKGQGRSSFDWHFDAVWPPQQFWPLSLPLRSAMLCPRCLVVQQKRNWRPAQWRSSDPYIHGNLGCRQCGCASDEEIDTHLARVGRLLSFAAPHQGWLDSWMERWCSLGRSTIKWLSHHGTLQRRPGAEAEDPGTCDTLYFTCLLCVLLRAVSIVVFSCRPLTEAMPLWRWRSASFGPRTDGG